jgi:phenylalanyl-tRNA synthetase beta chain
MLISVEWLKEFVDIDIDIDELSTRLTGQGVSVEGYDKIGNDFVLDLEITPNRPDHLSVFGIAREIKAIRKSRLKKNPFDIEEKIEKENCPITVEIENSEDCPRYAGCVVEGVSVGPSPEWLTRRLEVMGVRSVNNIVDATNYILLEMGHPLHAFDSDMLKDNLIIVRRARRGEKIITLDEVERELEHDQLVIADKNKPVAIAGIMGGAESEIKKNTTNIFIESAFFNPTLIRRGVKKLNLSTESSYRFERKADITAPIPALIKARDLIIQLSNGRMKGGITDIFKGEEDERKVFFTLEWLNGFLGSNLSKDEVIESLSLIDLPVSGDSPFEVKVPPFRRDIEIKEDIAEEVIRIVGFDAVPICETIVFDKISSIPQLTQKTGKIREYLTARGYDEVVNISFLSDKELEPLHLDIEPIRIQNPITSTLTHMRPTLIPGILKTVKSNINSGNRNIRFFELGSVYIPDPSHEKVHEPLSLVGVAVGKSKQLDWRGENRTLDYYDIKGDIEGLFDYLNIGNLHFKRIESSFPLTEKGSTVSIDQENIGCVGILDGDIGNFFDISKRVLVFEIKTDPLLDRIDFQNKFTHIPKYPSILRDLCLHVPPGITHQKIEETIKKEGKGLVEDIQLFDTYQKKGSHDHSRSLTYSLTFRSDRGTLKDEEVNTAISEILKKLSEEMGIKLRGEN